MRSTARAVLLSTGAEYRRLPVADLDQYEGRSVFYAAGPPEGQLCGAQRVGVIGGGNSAAQAAVWLARGGALVTLLHRRANLSETMSQYLIDELERYGVAVRDRSEVSALHGEEGRLESVTLTDGSALPLSFLFLFLGASPCTDWLDDVVARDANGFILTGPDAGARRACSKPACRASTPPATCGRGRSSAARPLSERARRSCASSTSSCRSRLPQVTSALATPAGRSGARNRARLARKVEGHGRDDDPSYAIRAARRRAATRLCSSRCQGLATTISGTTSVNVTSGRWRCSAAM